MSKLDGTAGVIWLTGYSSAGKTSLGRIVTAELAAAGRQAMFLDGDDLRGILGRKWGYSEAERRELARVYFRLASHLASQGSVVVISAVAMYEDIYAWFRDNVSNGMLVYLDVPLDVRRRRDEASEKGVYGDDEASTGYEAPDDPDLLIENSDQNDLTASADRVLAHFQGFQRRHSDRGRGGHWNSFYSEASAPSNPSPFAIQLGEWMTGDGSRLLEVGCGNGRDASYFQRLGLDVLAVDKSAAAITFCKRSYEGPNISFLHGDVTAVGSSRGRFDFVYARFVLHAMTREEEASFLVAASDLLRSGGRLFIEARSIRDPLARQGEVLSPTERIHGHYRRFLVPDELAARIEAVGLQVASLLESNGLAPFAGEDPVVVRITATKI